MATMSPRCRGEPVRRLQCVRAESQVWPNRAGLLRHADLVETFDVGVGVQSGEHLVDRHDAGAIGAGEKPFGVPVISPTLGVATCGGSVVPLKFGGPVSHSKQTPVLWHGSQSEVGSTTRR